MKVGPYHVGEVVGQGAHGRVHQGREEGSGGLVALKFFDRKEVSGEAIYRFEREVRLLQGVDHPHVVRPHWVDLKGDPPVYVMEWVGGGSLEDRFESADHTRIELLGLLAGACRGVEALHERGIVHRDLKPANILIDSSGMPKVSDLGLARTLQGETLLTQTGQCVGTLEYMAPEQIEGRRDRVGPGTDLYALGIILFRILAGALPFAGNPLHDRVRRALREGVPSLLQVDPNVSPDLAQLCREAVRIEVRDRGPSVGAFGKVLEQNL